MTKNHPQISILRLREALEHSWDAKTSYLNVSEEGNPALGQCYPTARMVQHFFPEMEIVEGEVLTGGKPEQHKHFWNILIKDGVEYHIDLSWQQFPVGSTVENYKVRDRETLGDSPPTIERCNLLLERISRYLATND